MFIIGKYVKIRFKNMGSPHYFLSSRGHKIKNITKIEQRDYFVYTLDFIFYGASHIKIDLHKYMI